MTMIFTLLAVLATTGTPAAYPVTVTLTHAERLLGTPELTVTDGEPAAIQTDRYALKVIVAPDTAPNRARIISAVSLKRDGVWRVVAHPKMTVTLGQIATIEQPGDTSGGPMKVSFLVQPPR